jgi:hypothetical protein
MFESIGRRADGTRPIVKLQFNPGNDLDGEEK